MNDHSIDEHDWREQQPGCVLALVFTAFVFTVGFVLGAWIF
jgi:hypothetical protein